MVKDDNFSRKESFRLWWEYLKRGTEYKNILNAFNEVKISKEAYERFYSRKKFPDMLVRICHHFGDIYRRSFDEWWRESELKDAHDEVWNYRQIIGEDIDWLYSEFKESGKPEPSAKDFQDDLFERMCYYERDTLYLKLSLTRNGSIDGLIKRIKEMVKRKKKEIELEPCPTQPIRLEELDRYLRVYDFRTSDPQLKWREIAEIIYPKRNINRSLERSLYLDKAHAEKIIKNAERGVFPGKY